MRGGDPESLGADFLNISTMQNNYTRNANLFRAFILLGLALAFYIYMLNFKHLSEGQLISWTPIWFFPIVIGYDGFIANRLLEKSAKTGLETASDTVFELIKGSIGVWAIPIVFLLHLPFLMIRTRSVLLTAILGSLIWAIAQTTGHFDVGY